MRPAHGSGTQRLYSFRDVVVLKIVKRFLDTGVALQNIRTAVQHLRDRGFSDLERMTLMSDGATVYECTSPDQVVSLLQGDRASSASRWAWSGGTWRTPCRSCTGNASTPARRWWATIRGTNWPPAATGPSEAPRAAGAPGGVVSGVGQHRSCESRADHPPPGHGRLLRRRGAGVEAEPARKAGDRRRPRTARGRRHRLLRGQAVRGAFRDADGPGQAAVPERRVPDPPLHPVPGGQRDRHGPAAGPVPLVEPLSLDEAFVDLEAGGVAFDSATARATGSGCGPTSWPPPGSAAPWGW